ncbi:hypothetical protein V1527DRAFT_516266 [Lipomyces starkeyi]
MRLYKLRPHLIVIWDESTEQELDDSDDEGASTKEFEVEAFRPGSAAISDVPIVDGLKCITCERGLTHKCLQSKMLNQFRNFFHEVQEDQTVENYSGRNGPGRDPGDPSSRCNAQ